VSDARRQDHRCDFPDRLKPRPAGVGLSSADACQISGVTTAAVASLIATFPLRSGRFQLQQQEPRS
jgi:hypothetical protein